MEPQVIMNLRKGTKSKILQVLCGNTGDSLRELALKLDKEESNLKPPLDALEKNMAEEFVRKWNDKSSLNMKKEVLLLRPFDIKNPSALADKFRQPADQISQNIREQMSTEIKALLDWNPDQYVRGSKDFYKFIIELNRILKGPSLLKNVCLQEVSLSETTQALAKSTPHGLELLRLNRLLVEEIYPKEIAEYKKPIIRRGIPRKTRRTDSHRRNSKEIPLYINPDLNICDLIVEQIPCTTRTYGDDEPESENENLIGFDNILFSDYINQLISNFGLLAILGVLVFVPEIAVFEVIRRAQEAGCIIRKEDKKAADALLHEGTSIRSLTHGKYFVGSNMAPESCLKHFGERYIPNCGICAR